MKNKENKHCCDEMNFHLSEKEKIILYLPEFREYSIRVGNNILQNINFCPWCGNKLPESLREEYFDTLDNMGIETDIFERANVVPEEFKSDEWWKKRGL